MSDDKKAKAATSSVLTKFTQNQIQEMKEAFTMIDQNRDGLICVSDLKETYSTLGYTPNEQTLKDMIKEAPAQINFTVFLSLFSEKLSGTDSEDTLMSSFKMFDNADAGCIPEEYMKDLLQNMGDNFTVDEIRQTWKEAELSCGNFYYPPFVCKLKGKDQQE